MATAFCCPEHAVGVSLGHNVEGTTDYLASLDTMTPSSLAYGSVSPVDTVPLANPHFVFPAAPPSPLSVQSSLTTAPRRRRPLSAIETHTRSFSLAVESTDRIPGHAALPDFSFNPGACLSPDPNALLSPPISPESPRNFPSPLRPIGYGHRRGGSEFVGGRIREGNSIAVLNTSPTKLDSELASQMFQIPPRRRGHRRGISGAISTNDLPIIPPPLENPLSKGVSTPNSPTGFERKDDLPLLSPDEQSTALPEPIQQPLEQDKEVIDCDSTANSVAEASVQLMKPGIRARVGFSDTLEFIPRPLSLVSSDTSSVATARPGHSVSGSISSIVSTASPTGRDSPATPLRTPTSEPIDSRRSTAGAILERTTEAPFANEQSTLSMCRNSIPALLDVADATTADPATPSPTKSSKRWSFFGLEPLAGPVSPTKGPTGSSSSSDSTPRAMDAGPCSDHGSDSTTCVVKGSLEKHNKIDKNDSKKKKVKIWAGSLLPLKPKGHRKRDRSSVVRPPTPPASVSHFDDDEDEVSESEIPEPEMELEVAAPAVAVTEPPAAPHQAEWLRHAMDDASFPMIDLDAALGPFNTPLSYNPEWEAAQRAAGNSGKRRLHSAQGLKGFNSLGMHYHRRAESAPNLPPFDLWRSAIHRFGSSSTMADVFEEEEEEEKEEEEEDELYKDDGRHRFEGDEGPDGEVTPPAAAPATKDVILDKSLSLARRRSSGLSDRESLNTHLIRAECSMISLQDDAIVEEPLVLTFCEAKNFQGPRDSFDSGAPSPRQLPGTNDLTPVDDYPLTLPGAAAIPLSPYSISHSSSHPSPRSPMSIDAQRISTAPSSVTDDSFHSLLMGEPGPEVRLSVDYGIPSCTSSNSTMTRDSSFVPVPRPDPIRRGQRPVSVSSVTFGRRRSSLASLSRLINSSHGERSKLSMEVTLDSEPEAKKAKNSRTKRLGRMMQFWKPNKDGAATN